MEGGNFALVSQGFPQLVRVSSDVVRPDNSRVFPDRAPVICQIRMVNETPLVPDLERLEEMIADETSMARSSGEDAGEQDQSIGSVHFRDPRTAAAGARAPRSPRSQCAARAGLSGPR